jgi:hypothetical protein
VRIEQSEPFLPTLRGSIVLSGTVATAFIGREQAAAAVAGRWLTAPGEREALAAALGRALAAEDTARGGLYARIGDFAAEEQLALLHDQVAWLTVKYRASRGAYGVSLVPEWETKKDQIRDELVNAYTDLINGYGRQLDTLNPADALIARVELLRQGVLWTRLGLFPDHAEQLLSEQLVEAAETLWLRQGEVGLVVEAKQATGWRLYVLAGRDGGGQ